MPSPSLLFLDPLGCTSRAGLEQLLCSYVQELHVYQSTIKIMFYFCVKIRHTLDFCKILNSYMLPVNDNEKEKKQPPVTCIVILLDVFVSTNGWIKARVAATANLCCWVIWP